MQTQNVLTRLKRATTDRVLPTLATGAGRANGRPVLGEFCHNCGNDGLSAVVERRQLVPDESERDGNRVSLCDTCHEDAPTADSDRHHHSTTYDRCLQDTTPVDADAVRERDDARCRGCGVHERIVVGDDLHLHPVVPIAGEGHRHAHNYVSLCPTCHRNVHGRD